jgi:hypothetical protein
MKERPKCPRCGSSSIFADLRGYGVFAGCHHCGLHGPEVDGNCFDALDAFHKMDVARWSDAEIIANLRANNDAMACRIENLEPEIDALEGK